MDINIIRKQLSILKNLLALPCTDVCWSRYTSAEDVIRDLERIEDKIVNKDNDATSELLFLLSPTGSLQEISISSGWGNEFLVIANNLEVALGK